MSTIRSAVLGLLLGATIAGAAAAQGTPTKVYPYPGDASWFPMGPAWNVLSPFNPDAHITGAQPYGGNGSLDLNLYGAPHGQPGFFDWAFYGSLAQNQTGGFTASDSSVRLWACNVDESLATMCDGRFSFVDSAESFWKLLLIFPQKN